MQRYRLTEYKAACAATREVYDDHMRTTGATSLPVWIRSLGHNPALAKAYWERAKGTLFGGSLPLPLKEMVVFVVSARNGANYCSACHAQCVLHLDQTLDFTDLQEFLVSDTLLRLPVYYRSVVAFADKVAADPNALTDADFQALLDEGFSLDEISEVVAVVDMATMFNIYTSAMCLDLDPEYRAIL